jgi:membrane-anchored protein YejM (alkaline phosphatase superfamily)
LWRYLEAQKMLDNTIVIFTGDHGEEFMEKGRWGHNSEFVNEQIRVPLVMWLPGQSASVDDRFSAHMDVTATIMPLLGVQNSASDYSMGFDLTQAPARQYTLLADWERVAYLDREVKIAIPMTAKGFAQQTVTTADDQPIDDVSAVMQQKQAALLQAMRDVSLFKQKTQ